MIKEQALRCTRLVSPQAFQLTTSSSSDSKDIDNVQVHLVSTTFSCTPILSSLISHFPPQLLPGKISYSNQSTANHRRNPIVMDPIAMPGAVPAPVYMSPPAFKDKDGWSYGTYGLGYKGFFRMTHEELKQALFDATGKRPVTPKMSKENLRDWAVAQLTMHEVGQPFWDDKVAHLRCAVQVGAVCTLLCFLHSLAPLFAYRVPCVVDF